MNSKVARHKTHVVSVGNLKIGGEFPILVQSMTNTDTADIESTVNQIIEFKIKRQTDRVNG